MNPAPTPATSPYADALERTPGTAGRLDAAGARTEFWSYGDPDAPTTIVAVHGFRGDHHGLEPLAVALAGQARVVVPDLPGFGRSQPLPDARHDIPGYAAWLRAFVAGLGGGGRLVVLGHSFGSIVVAAALAEGLAPAGAVLVNPIAAPALAGPRGVMTRLAVLYYRLAARLPERAGLALLRNPLVVRAMSVAMAKTRDRRLRRWIHDQHDRHFSDFADRRVVLEAFTASVGSDVSEFAARIGVPALLVVAERDDIAPLAAQERLQPLFPDARLRVIPGTGHLVHYEAPGAAARHIRDFLAETAQEGGA